MKNLTLLLILLCLFQNSFAQQTKDYKGHVIDAKGNVYFNSTKVGYITKDSLIKNARGKKIGFINPDGSVTDANGKMLGKAGKDGKTQSKPRC